jgi:hypothetical protein
MADPQHEISIREIPSVVDLPGKPQNEAAEAEFLSIDDQRVQSLLKKLPDIIDYHLQKIPFEKKKYDSIFFEFSFFLVLCSREGETGGTSHNIYLITWVCHFASLSRFAQALKLKVFGFFFCTGL